MPGIATNGAGQRLISMELVVRHNLPKRSNSKSSNVTVRGTRSAGFRRSALPMCFVGGFIPA